MSLISFKWDVDGDGKIDKKELRQAIKALGILDETPPATTNAKGVPLPYAEQLNNKKEWAARKKAFDIAVDQLFNELSMKTSQYDSGAHIEYRSLDDALGHMTFIRRSEPLNGAAAHCTQQEGRGEEGSALAAGEATRCSGRSLRRRLVVASLHTRRPHTLSPHHARIPSRRFP